jgi:parallel beta-helix repeat protein
MIEPGATLNMAPGASIISYAPVMAKGAKDLPIIIQRLESGKPWGVFAVVGQREKLNEFDFLKISGGSPDYVNGIFFSGQLAIYWSNVKISNSEFSQSSGDDNLNVKYGLAEIRDNYFHNSGFDAIDFDYVSEGSVVSNSTFYQNGNDGIDISGSPVQILNNKIIESGDKGISVGERSKPLIQNNLINGCNIGIAVKDSSDAKIISNTIVNSKSEGIGLYQKKLIYTDINKAEVKSSIVWNNKEQITVDQNSSIEIENSDIQNGYQGYNISAVEPKFDSSMIAENLGIGFGKQVK